jgi:hypothetical protein
MLSINELPESAPPEESSHSQPDESSETPEGVVLTDEFSQAFDLIESRYPFLFVTGRAGTGKSTFVELLKTRLKSFAIVAPTGVAALNVGGQTIHSFFRIKPGPIDFSKLPRLRDRDAFTALQTLIIDEVSMVRADLLDAIDQMLRKNGKDRWKPFGGVQVVAIGDLFQLPPVISTTEEQAFLNQGYRSPFFFGATCLQETEIKTIEFTRVFRQREQEFINILNSIREGERLDEALPLLNEQTLSTDPDSYDGIVLTATNGLAHQVNSSRLNQIQHRTRTYKGKVSGDFRLQKDKLPAPMELTLKVGARVMFVKNDPNKRWVNGTLGTVTALDSCSVAVDLVDSYGTREVVVEKARWETVKYRYDAEKNVVAGEAVGAFEQIPLTLAWAVTIHKSQGKTFDQVHVNLGRGAFAAGQVYVALSRCRTLGGVTLERPVTPSDIFLNQQVIDFHRAAVSQASSPS